MNYILGSGISALTYALFNPEYQIITKKIELPSSDSFNLSVKVQATKENTMLLNILGLKAETKEIPIIYNFDGNIKNALDFDEKQRLQKLKLGTLKTNSNHFSGKIVFIGEKEKQNKQHTEKVFDIPMSKIVSELYNKCKDRIIEKEIKEITTKEIFFGYNDFVPYSKIVSTLPAPIFWELWSCGSTNPYVGNKPLFEYKPIYTSIFSSAPEEILKESLIYWITEKYIRTISDGKIALIEGNSQEDTENFVAKHSISGFLSSQVLPFGRMSYSLDNNSPAPNIQFLGRFAEWNPDIRLDKIVAKCTSQLAIENIWKEQKSFQSNFLNFSELNNTEEKQRLTKEYILHLYSQTDQLLNAINWKFYKDNRPIDYNKVSEQLIDIFKYWLVICIIWGVEPDEFVKTFNSKSKIVWDRLKEGKYK